MEQKKRICRNCFYWSSGKYKNEIYDFMGKDIRRCNSPHFVDMSERYHFDGTGDVSQAKTPPLEKNQLGHTDMECMDVYLGTGPEFGCIHFVSKLAG